MASFNRVVLMGNLTRDVEIRHIASGTAVTDVGLAVNERRKTPTGEWVEEVNFFDVTLWGRNAEVAGEYLSKGSPMLVEGHLKQDKWEQDGQKRYKVKVIGERLLLLGRRSDGGGGGQDNNNNGATAYSEPALAATTVAVQEIPF